MRLSHTHVNPECANSAHDSRVRFWHACRMKDDGLDWLRERLKPRGMKQKLADYLGLSHDKVSKSLSGERGIRWEEMDRIRRFFGMHSPGAFREDDVLPYIAAPDRAADDIARQAASRLRHGVCYRLARSMPWLGCLQGDIALIEIGRAPADGEIVLAGLAHPESGAASTVLRRYLPPWLVGGPDDAPARLDGPEPHAVQGVVAGIVRLPDDAETSLLALPKPDTDAA